MIRGEKNSRKETKGVNNEVQRSGSQGEIDLSERGFVELAALDGLHATTNAGPTHALQMNDECSCRIR